MFKFKVWVRAKVFDLSKLHSFFSKTLCISYSSHSLLISTFLIFFFPALLPDFFFPRLPSEFSWMCLLFPPGNPVWVEFRDFGQLSGISGHLAIHLKQDGKFYTCLCPHADDASSTCRGCCTYPRSTGLQSVCYTGGLEENGNSSLFGKAGVTVSLLGSECALVLLCPSHRAVFMNICSAACPRQNGLLHQQPNFFHSLNFWASQCSALYSVLSPLSACGDRRLGIPASFWYSWNGQN